MLRISVPPCAGSAGRCAIPDARLRHPFAAFVIETKEQSMRYDIHHEIAELRAELAHTFLSRTERADAKVVSVNEVEIRGGVGAAIGQAA